MQEVIYMCQRINARCFNFIFCVWRLPWICLEREFLWDSRPPTVPLHFVIPWEWSYNPTDVGSCWVRPIVYLYSPTLIECGLICHCRKCDSNELKGSASTSLMKAIIHSNNVGAALGAAPSVVASHPQQPVGTAGLPGSPAFMPTSSNYPSKSVYNPQQLQGHGGPHHRPPQQPQLPSSLPQPNQQLNNMAMMSGKFRLLVEFNSSPRFCCQFQQVTNGAVVLELDHCVHRLNLRSLFWWTKLVHQDFRKP